jgi:hypothetical protein
MFRFFIGWVLSALIVYFIGIWLPFWAIMIVLFITAFLIGGNIGMSFLANGLGFTTSWFLLIQKIRTESGSELPNKIAELMSVQDSQHLIVYILTLAFFIGGFSGLTGCSFKKVLDKKNKGYRRPVY